MAEIDSCMHLYVFLYHCCICLSIYIQVNLLKIDRKNYSKFKIEKSFTFFAANQKENNEYVATLNSSSIQYKFATQEMKMLHQHFPSIWSPPNTNFSFSTI